MGTIRRLASMKHVIRWETPPCAICGRSDCAPHYGKHGFDIVRCRSDGLIFVSPRPADLSAYYDEAYYEGNGGGTYESYEAHAESMQPVWSERLAHLTELGGGNGRLLDIGAATGRFVRLANESGWRASGIEMSAWAVESGRRAHSVDLHLGSLPHNSFDGITFDAITMWDVIEHLSDPVGVLRAARNIIAPDGTIAISTGAVPQNDPRASSSWYYPPWHLYYFSVETLTAALSKSGFVVREVQVASPSTPYALMTVWAQPAAPYSHGN